MDRQRHTLAETDCCGYLFETWTGHAAAPAASERQRPAPLRRIAALIGHVVSVTAGILAMLS